MTYCIVNRRAGYLYVNMAKAACSSVKLAIARHKGVSFEAVQWNRPHRYPASHALNMPPSVFRFTFVRHPLDRLVSCWADMIRQAPPDDTLTINPYLRVWLGAPFGEFARQALARPPYQMNMHFRPQCMQLFSRHGQFLVDHVYQFEKLQEGWGELQRRFDGLPDLSHERKSEHEPWQSYYDDELRQLAARVYRQDLEAFGYEE